MCAVTDLRYRVHLLSMYCIRYETELSVLLYFLSDLTVSTKNYWEIAWHFCIFRRYSENDFRESSKSFHSTSTSTSPININRSHLTGIAVRKCDAYTFLRPQVDVDQRIQFTVHANQLGIAFRPIGLRLTLIVSDKCTFGIVTLLQRYFAAAIEALDVRQPGDE